MPDATALPHPPRLLGAAGAAVALVGVLAVDVARHGWITRGDQARLRFFVEHRSHVVRLARFVTMFGSFGLLPVIGLAAAVLLHRRGVPRRLAVAPLAATLLTGLVVFAMKLRVDRSRPPLALHLVAERDRSFPSGHAADGTALYLTLGVVLAVTVLRSAWARRLLIGLVVLGCALLGLSRLVLGVHWPTDVVAGWATGFAISALVLTRAMRAAPPGTAEAVPRPAGASLPLPR